MRNKIKFLTILLACLVTIFIASSGFCAGAGKDRPTISDGERAIAVVDVQNCMSKHAYYHSHGLHCEEMADIWVKEDGAYAKTAHWGSYEGIDLIKDYYCTATIEKKKKALEAISKVSDVKNVPENLGAAYGYTIHTQTTPIIEVARDGKTAKGIWYTPGIRTAVSIVDGKAETSGTWFFERYAVDFVKEDGKWKIWHFQNQGDPGPPGWGEERVVEAREKFDESIRSGFPKPNKPDTFTTTQRWSPTLVPKIIPRFPEPYYTFSETFSY